jgi:hypothetical protein
MAQPVIVSTRITATGQKDRSLPVYLPNATTLAQAQAFFTAFAPLLDAVIDGVVAEGNVQLPLTVPGSLKGSSNSGAELRRGALLDYSAANINYQFGLWVPGWLPTGFAGSTVVVSGAFGSFVNGMLNTIGASGAAPTDRYGNDLTTFNKGVKSFRK